MKCAVAIPGFLFLALAGCIRNHHTHDVPPPPSSPQAAAWWQKTVNDKDLATLQVLHEVSERHRAQGTSATYVWYWMGRTMAAFYMSHHEVTVPVPESARVHMEARLREQDKAQALPGAEKAGLPGSRTPTWAAACGGCTAEEAMAWWQEAARKFAGN